MSNADFFPVDTHPLADPLVVGPSRLCDRLRAKVLGLSLDQQLAAGQAPESTRLLAARARDIVTLRHRTSIARSWDHLLRTAPSAPSRRTVVVPVRAAAILAAEPAIRELIGRLTAPLPVSAQGVATARVLLTDPTSPVYNRRVPSTLAQVLQAAITQLDPARPLMPAG